MCHGLEFSCPPQGHVCHEARKDGTSESISKALGMALRWVDMLK